MGMIILVYVGPNNKSAEGTKDLSPLQGFVFGGYLYPGVLPPFVVSSPLWGFLFGIFRLLKEKVPCNGMWTRMHGA